MSLEDIRDELKRVAGLSVSERGEGAGQFLFVKAGSKAVEVAPSNGGIWIEYWENPGEDGECKGEETVAADLAVSKVKQWLSAV